MFPYQKEQCVINIQDFIHDKFHFHASVNFNGFGISALVPDPKAIKAGDHQITARPFFSHCEYVGMCPQ